MTRLGLLLPVAVALLLIARPELLGQASNDPERAMVLAVSGAIIGVCLTAMSVLGYVRYRLQPIVEAAERVAGGEPDVVVPAPHSGLEARLARALAGVSEAMTERHEAATVDRLTGVGNRQTLLMSLFNESARVATAARSASRSWTWTTSRRSTTRTGTRPGTPCCAASHMT